QAQEVAAFQAGWKVRALKRVVADMSPIFQATNILHPGFNVRAWQAICAWKVTPEKPWIGLLGGTGGRKSRIAYLKALDIIEDTMEQNMPTKTRSARRSRRDSGEPRREFPCARYALPPFLAD
ncbi:MAG: hypothetical protein K9M97_09265, partial [Akkermansiaceae bacterium]|nr:hypothetical protein [Akkermansiaceae bacterium]